MTKHKLKKFLHWAAKRGVVLASYYEESGLSSLRVHIEELLAEYIEEVRKKVERTSTDNIKSLSISAEFDIHDKSVSTVEVEQTVQEALRNSTAAEALAEATTARFGDRVEFSGWWIVSEAKND